MYRRRLALSLSLLAARAVAPLTAAAQGAAARASSADSVSVSQAPVARLWRLESPAPSPRRTPKLLVYYDLEGMSGVTTIAEATWESDSLANARGRAAATRDVLAVLAGLRAAGIDSVGIVDYHGADDGRDVPMNALPKGTYRISRNAVDSLSRGAYDGVLFVGMHTGPNGGGFVAHTMAPSVDVRLNGRSVNESEWEAARWGRIGVPVLFVSGDDRLEAELQSSMPWVEYVTVKHARGFASAETLPWVDVERGLAAAAERAVERRRDARVPHVITPLQVALRTFGPGALGERLAGLPGITVVGAETRFTAADMSTAVTGVESIAGLAMQRFFQRAVGQAASDPAVRAALDRAQVKLNRDYAASMDAAMTVKR
jgi:D-amino peptidase